MKLSKFWTVGSAAVALAVCAVPASAETIKIGSLLTMSGSNAPLGENIDKGMKLYMKLNQDKLPSGVKIEIVTRDDGGPNADKARQLAQELIAREKVQILSGMTFTPNAMAAAPLCTEAKVPMVVMNAATSAITTMSPYIVRVSHTLWQSGLPLGTWAAKTYKTAYIAVSDFGPGLDAKDAFTKGFTDAGGKIVGSVRMPVVNVAFAPFMQQVKAANPEVLFVFVPAGKQATALMKAFGDLGLGKAGIKLIGPGDITTDEELANMGEVSVGVLTVFHYSAAATRPANKAFISAWKKEYGANSVPSFMAVGGWDGMDAIYHAIREQNGRIDPERTMELLRRYKNLNSPRGPISIDPETRDIVQTEYLREVRKVGGELVNFEIGTVQTGVKDPWKEINHKK
jgi:branched-chain amino acid transport system substrate-binding protein